jgi:DnaJ domain
MSDRDALAGKIDDAFTPYGVLGVPYNATDREIRAAYIKLAKEFHPDNWPDDPATEIRFKRITEAYNTLRDRHSYTGSRQNSQSPGARFSDARVLVLAVFFFLVTPGIILLLTRSQNIDPQSRGEDQAASSSSYAPGVSLEPAPAINITASDGSATQQASGVAPGRGRQEAAKLEGAGQKPSSQDIGSADLKDIPERAIATGGVKIAPADNAPPEVSAAASSRSDGLQQQADLRNEGLNRIPEGGAITPGRENTGTGIASAQPQTVSGQAQLNSGKVAANGSSRTLAAAGAVRMSPKPGKSTSRLAGAASARMNDILAGGL